MGTDSVTSIRNNKSLAHARTAGYEITVRARFNDIIVQEIKANGQPITKSCLLFPVDVDDVDAFCAALRRAVRGPLGALMVDAEQARENSDG